MFVYTCYDSISMCMNGYIYAFIYVHLCVFCVYVCVCLCGHGCVSLCDCMYTSVGMSWLSIDTLDAIDLHRNSVAQFSAWLKSSSFTLSGYLYGKVFVLFLCIMGIVLLFCMTVRKLHKKTCSDILRNLKANSSFHAVNTVEGDTTIGLVWTDVAEQAPPEGTAGVGSWNPHCVGWSVHWRLYQELWINRKILTGGYD